MAPPPRTLRGPPLGLASEAGLFAYRFAQAAGARGRLLWPEDWALPTPSPCPPPPAAALLAARGPEELLCFTERLEDLVCFWEEAASAGVGPDNYSFFYQLE